MLDSLEQGWNFCSPFPPDLWWKYTEVSTHIPWGDHALAHCKSAILHESDWKPVHYTVINPSKECTLLGRFTKRLSHFNTVMLVRTCITVMENHDRQQLEEGKDLFGLYLHFTVSQWRKSGQELLRHELSKSHGGALAPHGSFILVYTAHRATSPGVAPLTVNWAFWHKSPIMKIDYTGQFDEVILSTEVPSSKMALACVNLTSNYPAQLPNETCDADWGTLSIKSFSNPSIAEHSE